MRSARLYCPDCQSLSGLLRGLEGAELYTNLNGSTFKTTKLISYVRLYSIYDSIRRNWAKDEKVNEAKGENGTWQANRSGVLESRSNGSMADEKFNSNCAISEESLRAAQ